MVHFPSNNTRASKACKSRMHLPLSWGSGQSQCVLFSRRKLKSTATLRYKAACFFFVLQNCTVFTFHSRTNTFAIFECLRDEKEKLNEFRELSCTFFVQITRVKTYYWNCRGEKKKRNKMRIVFGFMNSDLVERQGRLAQAYMVIL